MGVGGAASSPGEDPENRRGGGSQARRMVQCFPGSFPLQSKSLNAVSFWLPQGSDRSTCSRLPACIGLCEVPNLSPAWELNFLGTAPSPRRWGEVQAVLLPFFPVFLPSYLPSFLFFLFFFFGGGGGGVVGEGKVCYLMLPSVPEKRQEGTLPGRGVGWWQRGGAEKAARGGPGLTLPSGLSRGRPSAGNEARGCSDLSARSCGCRRTPSTPGLPAPGEGASPRAARRLSAAPAASPPVCDVGDNGPG